MQSTTVEAGLVRIKDIIGDKTANPPRPGLLPISSTSWWMGVKTGKYPKPIKLGPRTTCWKRSEVLAVCEGRFVPAGAQ